MHRSYKYYFGRLFPLAVISVFNYLTVDSSSKFPVQPTERSAMQASASTMAAAAAEEIDIPELDTQGIIDL